MEGTTPARLETICERANFGWANQMFPQVDWHSAEAWYPEHLSNIALKVTGATRRGPETSDLQHLC